MGKVAAENKRVVWVLGAGFSKPLGGPLLSEFFEEHRFDRLRRPRWFDQDNDAWNEMTGKWRRLLNLFNAGLRSNSQPFDQKPRPWEDAEEFVEFLQLAAGLTGDVQAKNAIKGVDYNLRDLEIDQLAEVAPGLLAAVTAEFTHGASTSEERWEPYIRWAKMLHQNDSVITFNYDKVVEMAYAAAYPEQPNGLEGRYHKLHGSVDWSMHPQTGKLEIVKPIFDRICDPLWKRMVIGVPGPLKVSLASQHLESHWTASLNDLRQAHTVVFVGYRFLPSDSNAKRQLLASLAENKWNEMTIRMVLGPKRSDDVQRLEGMLRWSLGGRRNVLPGEEKGPMHQYAYLVHEPMYSQDFMTVFDRDRL